MQNFNTSSIHSRFIDLSALIISFLLFSFMTDHFQPASTVIGLLLYVSIVFVCLRLNKRLMFTVLNTSSRVVRVLSGNLLGFISGIVILSFAQFLLPVSFIDMPVIIFSSLMAFFMLGTLSPMVKTSHHDIIHH